MSSTVSIRGAGMSVWLALSLPALIDPASGDEVNLGARMAGGELQLHWDAVVGRSYMVERATSFSGPWPNVGTVVADTAEETWNDTEALSSEPRWYRLRYDPTDDGTPGNVLFVLPDGDFESGGGVGTRWFQGTPLNNAPLIVQDAPGWGVSPRSGSHFAWLGGYHDLGESPNHQSVLQYNTSILVPLQPTYLHLWYQIVSFETDPFADPFNLWLADLLALGPACQTNALISTTFITSGLNTTGWTHISYDLSAYQGQVICLAFEMRTNFIGLMSLFIDDVSFRDAP